MHSAIRSIFKRVAAPFFFAIAAIVSAGISVPTDVFAESRRATAYTTEGDKGGWIYAQITWSPNRGGKTYHGTIRGAYEDLEADGHCVLGMRSGSGGKKWYPLGPAVCPKGASHPFVYHYKAARNVVVQVCRVTRAGKWINCSGPK